ncbi:hypothetical protein JW872_03120 [Candidatus Babeliales bacterium]|nr:hypothetical protein [Candidatus Babeliales bacterium]
MKLTISLLVGILLLCGTVCGYVYFPVAQYCVEVDSSLSSDLKDLKHSRWHTATAFGEVVRGKWKLRLEAVGTGLRATLSEKTGTEEPSFNNLWTPQDIWTKRGQVTGVSATSRDKIRKNQYYVIKINPDTPYPKLSISWDHEDGHQ